MTKTRLVTKDRIGTVYAVTRNGKPLKTLVHNIRADNKGGEIAHIFIDRKKVVVVRLPDTFKGWTPLTVRAKV